MSEIYLTETDDFVTAQHKAEADTDTTVTLVVPSNSRLRTAVNLRLLQRELDKLGKEVVLRSDDSQIQHIIDSLPDHVLGNTEGAPPASGFVVGKDVAKAGSREEVAVLPIARPKTWKDFPPILILERYISASLLWVKKGVGVGRGLTLLMGIIGLFLALGVLYFLFVNSHRVEIEVFVKPEGVVKSFEVAASSTTESVDAATRRIPAQVYEFVEKSAQATKATGKDIIGDKATGTVTLYNKTDEKRELPKGSKLTLVRTEGEDLIYYLTEAAAVPKREATTTESTPGEFTVKYSSGKAEIPVIAAAIGEEFNINSGETFAVENLPVASMMAESKTAIKGGTRKEAVVVTQADQDMVVQALTERLTNQLKERIPKELPEGVVVESDAVSFNVNTKSFDKNVGAVADEVTAEVELKAVAYSYKKEDLEKLLSEALVGFVPERFTLASDQRKITIEGVKVQNNELFFFAKVSGLAVPKLDVDKLKKDLKGKRIEMAQAYLGSITVVDRYTISLFPKLPGTFQVLPDNPDKIQIKVNYESSN